MSTTPDTFTVEVTTGPDTSDTISDVRGWDVTVEGHLRVVGVEFPVATYAPGRWGSIVRLPEKSEG